MACIAQKQTGGESTDGPTDDTDFQCVVLRLAEGCNLVDLADKKNTTFIN